MQINTGSILVILLVALVVIPPQDYPKIARKLGRYWATLSRWGRMLKHEFENTR